MHNIVLSHVISEAPRNAVLSTGPDYLAALMNGKPPRVFSLLTKEEQKLALSVPVNGAAFRRKNMLLPGREIAFACGEHLNTIQRFDLDFGIALMDNLFMPRANCLAYSHDGRFLAAGSLDGIVRVWNMESDPVEVVCNKVSNSAVVSLAITGSNDMLVAVTASGSSYTMDKEGAVRRFLYDGPKGRFMLDSHCVATNPVRPMAAMGGQGGSVILSHLTLDQHGVLDTGYGYVRHLEFLSNLRQLAVVGDKGVQIWDLQTLKLHAESRDNTRGKPLMVRHFMDLLYVLRA